MFIWSSKSKVCILFYLPFLLSVAKIFITNNNCKNRKVVRMVKKLRYTNTTFLCLKCCKIHAAVTYLVKWEIKEENDKMHNAEINCLLEYLGLWSMLYQRSHNAMCVFIPLLNQKYKTRKFLLSFITFIKILRL